MSAPFPIDASWLFGMREEEQNQLQMNGSHLVHKSHVASSSMPTSAAPSTQKKKRTQPDPDAEVIALSPKTLTSTNRFICDVCERGFQREQNLQLHRRGHSLPWKLKLKNNTSEVKKKVYVCPEPTCVHHNPSRALGDLTGIKKHFFRKHCEKKWECEKCSKKYAVQSDWKAHTKTCGTKEYRCDCGTLFSRRDSFTTHQAFCNAIAKGIVLSPTNLSTLTSQLLVPSRVNRNDLHSLVSSAFYPNSNVVLGLSPNYKEEYEDKLAFDGMRQQQLPQDQAPSDQHIDQSFFYNTSRDDNDKSPVSDNKYISNTFPSSIANHHEFSRNLVGGSTLESAEGSSGLHTTSDKMMSDAQVSQSFFTSAFSLQDINNASSSSLAHLSATALLQKAAQVGSSYSNSGSTSFLTTLGSSTLSSMKHDFHASLVNATSSFSTLQNNKYLHGGWMGYHDGAGSKASSGEYAVNGMLSFEKLVEHESFKEQQPQNLFNGSIIGGGCDTSTRDFLGIGQIVRQMSGGFPRNDLPQHHQEGHQLSSRTGFGGGASFSPN